MSDVEAGTSRRVVREGADGGRERIGNHGLRSVSMRNLPCGGFGVVSQLTEFRDSCDID